MRLLIGDDVGQAKVVDTSTGIDTANYQSARATITSFFPPSRTRPIQHALRVCYRERDRLAAVFSKGGFLRIFDPSSLPTSPDIVFSYTLAIPTDTDTVALGICEHVLYAATAAGKTLMLDLKSGKTRILDLPGPISTFTASKNLSPSGLPAAVANGGENRDVEVFVPTTVTSHDGGGEEPAAIVCTSVWKAKNVKPSPLKLEIPIHPTQIIFLPSAEGSYRLVVATKYGHIRVYDTAVARRPVFSAEPSKTAICRLQIHPDSALPPTNQPLVTQGVEADKAKLSVNFRVIYSNTTGGFAVYNLHERREVGVFKELTGAVLGVDVEAEHGLIAGVGYGRYLAVYDAANRTLKTRVYVKTQGCSVVVLDGGDHMVEEDKSQDKEEDDVWGTMQEVGNGYDDDDDVTDKLVQVKVKRKKALVRREDTGKRQRIES